MAMGRFKRIHLALMIGITLFIPLFLAYSLYVELSGSMLLSSDVGFEDPGDEELSPFQNEFKIVVPGLFSTRYLRGFTSVGTREKNCLD